MRPHGVHETASRLLSMKPLPSPTGPKPTVSNRGGVGRL